MIDWQKKNADQVAHSHTGKGSNVEGSAPKRLAKSTICVVPIVADYFFPPLDAPLDGGV